MGTTRDDLISKEGITIGFSLIIEGYEYVITDAADVSKVVTAYGATQWSQALPGLKVDGNLEQSIRPWSNSPDVSVLRFVVTPDDTDQLGIDIFNTNPDASTNLHKVFRAGVTGINVAIKDHTQFGASGAMYVGNERIEYSGLSTAGGSDVFTIGADSQGTMAPFGAEAADPNKFPRSHYLPGQYEDQSQINSAGWSLGNESRVTSGPTVWVGKWIGLWVHRIVAGVWDVKSQAQLIFAGKITSVGDSVDGTIIECEDARAAMRDHVIMRDQFIGYVPEGVLLLSDNGSGEADVFVAKENIGGTVATTTLTVVASGATAPYEINEGYYTAHEFVSALNAWLSDAGYTGLTGKWSMGIVETTEGIRTRLHGYFSTGALRKMTIYCTRHWPWKMLGFKERGESFGYNQRFKIDTGFHYSDTYDLFSDGPPYRRYLTTVRYGPQAGQIAFDDFRGTLIDQLSLMPPGFRASTGAGNVGGTWAIVSVGWREIVALAFFDEFSNITRYTIVPDWAGTVNQQYGEFEHGVSFDEPDRDIEIKQILVLSGTFTDVVARLFLAVDGNEINSTEYDDVGPTVGAGIPWELLQSDFVSSCKAIEEGAGDGAMLAVIKEPTRLMDVLLPEMMLRFAWIMFDDERFVFVSPQTPSNLAADHVLTENNKAAVAGDVDALLTESIVDSGSMRNILKVDYNQDSDGTYRGHINVVDESSVSDYGPLPVTIKAANSYSDLASTGAAVEAYASNLAARMIPVFGRPLRLFARTINFNLFHMVPGDLVTITDGFARSPTSGQRGLNARPCTVMSVRYSFGGDGAGLLGEMTALYTEELKTFEISSASEIDETYTVGDFTAGYDSGAPFRIKLKQHAYSQSSESKDVTYYAVNDEIDIYEIDPASVAAPRSWTGRTITAIDTVNDILTIDAALTGHTSAEIYRVRPSVYTAASTTQKAKAFQANSTSYQMSDGDPSNTWGDRAKYGATAKDVSLLPSLIPTAYYGADQPLDAGLMQDLNRATNNLISYRTAAHLPVLWGPVTLTAAEDDWQMVGIFPIGLLIGGVSGGYKRELSIAPEYESTGAGTFEVRVTLSTRFPIGDTNFENCIIPGDSTSETWTETGAAGPKAGAVWLVEISYSQDIWVIVQMRKSTASGAGVVWGLNRLYENAMDVRL